MKRFGGFIFLPKELPMSIFAAEKPELSAESLEFVEAAQAKNAPPVYTLAPETVRQNLIDAQAEIQVKLHPVDIRDEVWRIGPTGSVNVRIVRPKHSLNRIPCMVYMHGGGWVAGGKETHDRLIRELAVEAGVAVVFPEYGLAPEIRYPISLEQCYAVLEHVGNNAEELGFDPDGFVLAGDSAGGNLATVMAMLARERGGPEVIFQLLFYPVTDADFDTKSYKDFAEGPWLTRKAMKWYWDAYLPDVDRRAERNASPLRARDEDLEGMPPALIITAENDVLRDEGEEYARRLDEVEVDVSSVRMNGTIHDFAMLNGLADSPQTRAAIALAVAEIKKAFQATFPQVVR